MENKTDENNATTQEVVTVTPYAEQVAELEVFLKDYDNLIVTEDNYKEMNEKRLVLYRKRQAIQKIMDANKKALNAAKKTNEEKGQKLVDMIWKREGDIETKQKLIDQAKEKKAREEEARKAKHANNIAGFGPKLVELMKIQSSAVLEEKKAACLAWQKEYDAEEYKAQLDLVVNEYIETIDALIPVKKAKEDAAMLATANAVPSNIPADLKAMNANFNTKPEPMDTRASAYPAIPKESFAPSGGPSLEDRAKSGEFSVGVACNFEYGGFRFYIDPKLPEFAFEGMKVTIIDTIDNLAF